MTPYRASRPCAQVPPRAPWHRIALAIACRRLLPRLDARRHRLAERERLIRAWMTIGATRAEAVGMYEAAGWVRHLFERNGSLFLAVNSPVGPVAGLRGTNSAGPA